MQVIKNSVLLTMMMVISSVSHAIIGGRIVKQTEQTPVVAFSPFSWGGHVCTATKIGETRFITSAHCVIKRGCYPFQRIPTGPNSTRCSNKKMGILVKDQVKIVDYKTINSNEYFNEARLQVKSLCVKPDFIQFGYNSSDIAIIDIAEDSLTENLKSVPIASLSADSPLPGETIRFYGYGCRTEWTRQGNVGFSSNILKVGTQYVKENPESVYHRFFTGDLKTSTDRTDIPFGEGCPGDSGGPAFQDRDGEFIQVGITSAGHWDGDNSFFLELIKNFHAQAFHKISQWALDENRNCAQFDQ